MSAPLNPADLDAQALEATGALREALIRWPGRVAVASSFSREDVVAIHLTQQVAAELGVPVRVFALDTGRLPEETWLTAERVRRELGVAVEWHHPQAADVEALLAQDGPFGFRESVACRQRCCDVRKVRPLARALAGLDAWITGLRREHGPTRADLPVWEPAVGGEPAKLNPLAGWSTAQVSAWIARHSLPEHPLHARGYPSIGCAPCTRAVAPGEPMRAGRWWWEDPDLKECGLHRRPAPAAPTPAETSPGPQTRSAP